jgi:hypothetical protein
MPGVDQRSLQCRRPARKRSRFEDGDESSTENPAVWNGRALYFENATLAMMQE